jgi:hypothetical protein
VVACAGGGDVVFVAGGDDAGGTGGGDAGGAGGGGVVLGAGGGEVVGAGGGDADGLAGEEDGDGEAVGVIRVGGGWRETGCTAAAGWSGGPGRFATVEASAVPAVTAKIAAPAMTAALAAPECRSLVRRRGVVRLGAVLLPSRTWCSAVPWTAGGGPAGHRAASRSAASPRCGRPRCGQSGP